MIPRLKKFCATLRIAVTLVLARTFGKYEHSVTEEFTYARYRWCGRVWAFPTTPFDGE